MSQNSGLGSKLWVGIEMKIVVVGCKGSEVVES